MELAASWTRLMPCAAIAAQIQQDMDFLAGGPRNAPDRHQSLRALFDHSWALLSPREQQALARLSVFRGRFAAEQATAVAGTTWPLLLGLVDKSLVEAIGAQRYDLHYLVRQYAARKLVEMVEVEDARQQHFESYQALGQQLMERITGPEAVTSLVRSHQEHENFRAALAWGVATQQSEATLGFTGSVFLFWLRGGHWREAEQWLQQALAQVGDTESSGVSVALCQLSSFMALQGRYQDAFPLSQRALLMARRLADPWTLVINLFVQGQALPDKDQACAAFEETIAICREHETEGMFGRFWTDLLWVYGDRLLDYGYVAEAEDKYRESLARYRMFEDVNMIAYPLGNLGRLALRNGRLQEAHDLISESVHYAQGGNRVALGDWLFRLGQVHLYLDELEAATADLNTTLMLYEEINNIPGQAGVLACLAELALLYDDVMTADRHIQDSLNRYRTIFLSIHALGIVNRKTQYRDVTDSLLRVGLVAAALGEHRRAVMTLNCAEALAADSGNREVSPLQVKVAAALARLQENLPAAAFDDAAAHGRQMSLEALFATV